MKTKLPLIAAIVCMFACVHSAFALGVVVPVTKETQANLGLEYKLTAEKVDSEAVLVSIEIPRKGKLSEISRVGMHIGKGRRPEVAVTLSTTSDKDGTQTAHFQVSPELADKCSVHLIVPDRGRSYTVYQVELKGYVQVRK